jgi:K+-sensing histidine kinase KdpD
VNGMEIIKKSMINCPTVLSGMSHEMRTHMNAIVAFSFLMKENCSNDLEREDFNNQIFFSCEQLIELFDSFLDSVIIDSVNPKADAKTCKPYNMLDELFEEFREVIKKKGYSDLEFETEIRIPCSTELSIDQNKILRIIRSLFQNSIKNTNSGYIKIGSFLKDDKLTFYVLDSGQGYIKCKEFLDTEDLNLSLAQHFDTYTAINITLVRKLIQVIGGTIWIERNDLTGAGIYFSVPVAVIPCSDDKTKKRVKSMILI